MIDSKPTLVVFILCVLNDLLTVSQVEAIRQKRFPKLVAKEVRKARKGNK